MPCAAALPKEFCDRRAARCWLCPSTAHRSTAMARVARVALLWVVTCVTTHLGSSDVVAQPAASDPLPRAIAAELDAWTTGEEPTIHGARIALPERVQEFYTRRGFHAAWDNAHNAEQLHRALAESYDEGLDPK